MSSYYSTLLSWWYTPVIPLARNSPVDTITLKATPCMIAMTQFQLKNAIGNLRKVREKKLKPKIEKPLTVMSELHNVFQKRITHGSISGPINIPELVPAEDVKEKSVENELKHVEEKSTPIESRRGEDSILQNEIETEQPVLVSLEV
jgi:hypothetical protein